MLVRPAYGAAVLICAFARTLCAEPIAVTPTRFILTAASFIDPSGGLVAGAADAQFTFEGGRFRAAAESRAQTNEAFVLWDAFQDTTIDSDHFFGSSTVRFLRSPGGIADLPAASSANQGVSQMNLTIDLKRAMPYHFSGTLVASPSPLFFGLASLEEFRGLPIWEEPATARPRHFNHRGVLMPGVYFVGFALIGMLDSASAEPGVIGQSPGTSAVDFDFSLGAAATPEPASLVLLSTGLVGAAVRCRRCGRPRLRHLTYPGVVGNLSCDRQ